MQDTSLIYIGKDWDKVIYPESDAFIRLHAIIAHPLSKDNLSKFLELASKYDNVSILIKHCIEEIYDLSFLENLPNLKMFSLSAFDFNDFEQFSYIPDTITELRVDDTKSHRLSLEFIKRFNKLKFLAIEKHKKNIEVISDLNNLEEIQLRSITMPNLGFIGNKPNLKRLEVRLGGTNNLNILPSFKALEKLDLWAINKLDNIDAISDCINLSDISLDQLSNLENVKSLRNLIKLTNISLCRMKRLKSLQWIADAPNLMEFSITQTSHLDTDAFKPLKNHKSLQAANIYIGRKNTFKVREMLNLPEIKYLNG